MKVMGRAIALAAAGLLSGPAFAATAGAPAAPAAGAAAPAGPAFASTVPTPGVGMPDGRMGLQDQVTAIGQRAADFHDGPLLWMCVLISIFVLVLLGYTMFRFRRGANPTPSKTSHNLAIEVVWTLVPVLILVALAVPSIRLLRAQYSPPPADLTVKVTGNQWNWTYAYPDNGGFELTSNILKERGEAKAGERFRTDADGPALLAVDERLVIPAGKVVKFIVTSSDVIHSFAMPAFWIKMDANPGRLNEVWVKVDRPGVYFGQCSELCGARHGYMPIAIEVLPEARFNSWLASKGGTPRGAKPTAATALDAAATAVPGNAAEPAKVETPAIAQPAINQAAVAQN